MDIGGRQTQTSQSADGITLQEQTHYDLEGKVIWDRDTQGIVTSYEYDDEGRVVFAYVNDTLAGDVPQHAASAGKIEYQYDERGYRNLEIDEAGRKTKYEYNGRGLMTKTWLGYVDENDEGLLFQFEYDDYGRETKFIDPDARETLKVYDTDGRLVREYKPAFEEPTHPHYNKRMATAYEYAECGKLLRRVEGIAASVGAALTQTRWVRYDFADCTSAMRGLTYSDGRRVTFKYVADRPGLVEKVEVWQGAVRVWWRQLEYELAHGLVRSEATPDGTVFYEYDDRGGLKEVSTSQGVRTQYESDAFGNLRRVKHYSPLTGEWETLTHTYDAAKGRRTGLPDRPATLFFRKKAASNRIIDGRER